MNYEDGTTNFVESSDDLQGYVTQLVQFGRDTFVVVNRYDDDFNFESKLLVLLNWQEQAGMTAVRYNFNWQGDIRNIYKNGDYIWVSERQNGVNQVMVYHWNESSNEPTLVGDILNPVVPGISFVGVE